MNTAPPIVTRKRSVMIKCQFAKWLPMRKRSVMIRCQSGNRASNSLNIRSILKITLVPIVNRLVLLFSLTPSLVSAAGSPLLNYDDR